MIPRIIKAPPPNFEAIAAKFDIRGKPIYFAYGDTIFNPAGVDLPPSIIAHEKVHLARQHGDPVAWWERYIASREFRLAEELPAHQAEYRYWLDKPDSMKPIKGFRSMADYHLLYIAKRLSSPLYGGLQSPEGGLLGLAEAKRMIRDGSTGTAR